MVNIFKRVTGLFRFKDYISNKYLLWATRICFYLLLYIFLLESNFLWLTGYMPNIKQVQNPEVAVASELYTKDSVLIGRYYTENRTPVSLNEVAPIMLDALVCTEDIRFFKHHGFDVFALFGSFTSAAKGEKRGGSTLTQQLAKNMFETRSVSNQGILGKVPVIRTFIFKTKEWITASKLEIFYSKKEILEMYLNTIEFGNNWYGIKVAANNYFDKLPADLNIQEAALLTGMLKATTSYNPFRFIDKATERRNIVLDQLLKYKVINSTVHDSLCKRPIELKLRNDIADKTGDSYLRNYAGSAAKAWCDKNGYNLHEDGLHIYTTVNSKLQQYAETAMHDHLSKMQKQFNDFWGKRNPWCDEDGKEIPGFIETNIKRTAAYKALERSFQGNTDSIMSALMQPKAMKVFTWNGQRDTVLSSYDSLKYYTRLLQGGMMSWNPFTGEIVAYVGGNDPQFFKYDHVTISKRQPGSTFKVFAYTAAIDKGYSPCDIFIDKPVVILYNETERWQPRNVTWVYTNEPKTLRRALAQSVNSITVQLTEKIGWNAVVEYAHKLGIRSKLANVPSICLGSSDVSVFELTNAYGTILADGIYRKPGIISKIIDKHGNEIFTFKPEEKRALSEETAFLMRYMLQGGMQEPEGTSLALWSYNLFQNGNEIAGKTGTTSNYSDAWYVGMTQNLVTGIWTGTEYRSVHFRSNTGQGSRMALPIFGKFMEAALKNKNPEVATGRFPKPKVKITRKYQCNYAMLSDSLMNDSLNVIDADSLLRKAEMDSLIND